jgi:hypothetical protein
MIDTNAPYVSLIFEINSGLQQSHADVWSALVWTSRPPSRREDRTLVTLWVAWTFDQRWRTSVPIEPEEHGFQPIGPMAWQDAEKAVRGLKQLFDATGLPCVEQTCSDD